MNPQTPLRVGVIGFGKLGLLHAGIANGLASAELVAAADTSDVLLNGFKENKPDLATYQDYEKMLNAESLDAVFIASPTHLHVPMAMECVARGLPFFVEKPLGISAQSARPLVDALGEKPVVNMVGYMGRQIDTFRKGKEIVASGALGKLQHLRASMYVAQLFKKGKGWRYDRSKSGGGVLRTQNSHLLDALHWYFGRIASVSGHVKSVYSGTVDDFTHAYFKFESGLTGFMDTSWSIRHYRVPSMSVDVQGECGTLTVTDDEVKMFLDEPRGEYLAGWSRWRKPELYRPVEVDVGGPQYTLHDADFLKSVAAKQPSECNVTSAYHVEQAIDAIYESSDSGGREVVISR
ncbi:MAG: Gfo/Idh/MocA family oxidoreductase [Phycisphaerales bacterium]|nr:Gfo/Idh/MocA family oxidoreductase [Phycisphaerales bacterium]